MIPSLGAVSQTNQSRIRIRHAEDVNICRDCGAAYIGEHRCPEPDAIDLATVKAIQTLAAGGLSPEEIAEDLGVKLGWRMWAWRGGKLTGVGDGIRCAWPLDRPIIAVCADPRCGGSGKRCQEMHGTIKAPACRIHAMRECLETQDECALIFGYVALWGDVIECTKGWLATKAYPLGFHELWLARAYGVCHCGHTTS